MNCHVEQGVCAARHWVEGEWSLYSALAGHSRENREQEGRHQTPEYSITYVRLQNRSASSITLTCLYVESSQEGHIVWGTLGSIDIVWLNTSTQSTRAQRSSRWHYTKITYRLDVDKYYGVHGTNNECFQKYDQQRGWNFEPIDSNMNQKWL